MRWRRMTVSVCAGGGVSGQPRHRSRQVARWLSLLDMQKLACWSLQLLSDFAAECGGQAQPAQQEAEAERADLFEAAFELVLFLAELLDHVGTEGVVEVSASLCCVLSCHAVAPCVVLM